MSEEAQEELSSSERDNTIISIPDVTSGKTDDSPAQKRENTRSEIAMLYVKAFFITIFVSFIIGLFKCFSVKDYIDFLIAISGILSGPLGFIIGYYFKAGDKEN